MSETDVRALVYQTLKTHGPMTRKQLVEVCHRDYDAISRALSWYVDTGDIIAVPGSKIRTAARGRSSSLWQVVNWHIEIPPLSATQARKRRVKPCA